MIFIDQLQRTVHLPSFPERIISLVPSQTELLVDLGLEEKIVGITKFCVHPGRLKKTKSIIGGTKNYRMEVIETLNPDLIIGNKEENDQMGIEALSSRWPVWMSDISNLEEAIDMMVGIGKITNSITEADRVILEIANSLQNPMPQRGTCVYLIWENPMMAAGKSTFIHEMLALAGFTNLLKADRYPEISLKTLQELNPEFLLLSSEPFPYKEKHLKVYGEQLPNTEILLVDGEMFSWYGSRLRHSMDYFKRLF